MCFKLIAILLLCYYQVYNELEKFQDLVKDVSVCAGCEYVLEHQTTNLIGRKSTVETDSNVDKKMLSDCHFFDTGAQNVKETLAKINIIFLAESSAELLCSFLLPVEPLFFYAAKCFKLQPQQK